MLIITGTIAYDYIMDFPGQFGDHILPDSLHKINLSFIVNKFAQRRGGTAGNASYSLALLKTPHILFSTAGKDIGQYKETLQKLGVNTKHIVIKKDTYTATGFAMTDKLDNQIWGFFYGAADENYKLNLLKIATKNDLVLVGPSGAKASMSMLRQCIKGGVPYMFDPGFILTQATDKELALGFKNAAYVIGNDYEMDVLQKRIPDFDSASKKRIIITTFGKKGAVISDHGEKTLIKPAYVRKVIDPTGAGDAWRAGFLSGLARGFDLAVCGQMGSVAASYAVEHYGTQEQKYSLKDFKNRYLKTYKNLLHL